MKRSPYPSKRAHNQGDELAPTSPGRARPGCRVDAPGRKREPVVAHGVRAALPIGVGDLTPVERHLVDRAERLAATLSTGR
jgi:hypothetical protein